MIMEQKTIKEWFETLPEPIRSQAFKSMDKAHKSNERLNNLWLALAYGFVWDETIQGWDYWNNIHDRALSGEFNTK